MNAGLSDVFVRRSCPSRIGVKTSQLEGPASSRGKNACCPLRPAILRRRRSAARRAGEDFVATFRTFQLLVVARSERVAALPRRRGTPWMLVVTYAGGRPDWRDERPASPTGKKRTKRPESSCKNVVENRRIPVAVAPTTFLLCVRQCRACRSRLRAVLSRNGQQSDGRKYVVATIDK